MSSSWNRIRKFLDIRDTTVVFALVVGTLFGMAVFTFRFAEGFSYFSSDPKACVNCHIMREQYDSWRKSSHHAAATCVQCHLPHSFFGKWLAKAENGYHHSKAFTLQNFHEPIMIHEKNSKILQENCLHCHAALVQDLVHGSVHGPKAVHGVQCVQCHAGVGHGPLH